MGEFLAGLLWDQPGNQLDHRLLAAAVAKQFGRDHEVAVQAQLDTEVRTATFLVRDEGGNYRFLHRSFMEYLLARRLRTALADPDRTGGLQLVLDTERLSREVIDFANDMGESVRADLVSATREVIDAAAGLRPTLNAVLVGWGVGESAWRQSWTPTRPIMLDGAALAGIDLGGIDLSGASLRGALLSGAILDRANLDGADLSGSDLSLAAMAGASARRANFDTVNGANLSAARTDFTGASFTGADLLYADLRHTKLTQTKPPARLVGAILVGATGVNWPLPPTAAPSRPKTPRLHWRH